ncbi:MAG: DUF1553 domain-containing protein [Planctomycetes bacterium]|nr:DUF1553 domain-containing protein [Planctomycetota bacterium]
MKKNVFLVLLSAFALTLLAAWSPSFVRTIPPSEPLVALRVFPTELVFDNPFATAQILVTGTLEGGIDVDRTRSMVLAGGGGLLSVDAKGLARPLANGVSVLELRVDHLTIEIPVKVLNLEQTYHPSFIRDVQPVLSRIGCNSGSCHGSADGKNGFKLSLRGYDPQADLIALTDDLAGRRFNPSAPDQSLFLLKPTGGVPHEGGQILEEGGHSYQLLRQWIADGAPFDPQDERPQSIRVVPSEVALGSIGATQQFVVLASFADGRERDVTNQSFFETSNIEVLDVEEGGVIQAKMRGEAAVLVRYEGSYSATPVMVLNGVDEFKWKSVPAWNPIDEHVYTKLQKARVQAGDLCTDAEFLRRIYLDLTGRTPTVLETRSFLMDARDSRLKRQELIDRLIGSADFIEHWTSRWADLLQINSKFLGKEGAEGFRRWVQAQIASNKPYDEFVSEILGASGSNYENPPASFYKIQRQPDLVMENTTQLFLGVRFNCNKCHDHPFERWTRSDHWQLASAFGRVKVENKPGSPIMPMIGVDRAPAYEEIISDAVEGELTDPETGQQLEMRFPYEHAGEVDPELNRRQQLVQWLTDAKNPYFARSYVNRIWGYLLGIGIIDPVDDIRAGNPPTNPELLDYLTEYFLQSDMDVRELLRHICNSRTYQLTVASNEWNESDQINFSHGRARRLPAEVLHRALHQATGTKVQWSGARAGTPATQLLDSTIKTADGFLDLFGRPPRESVCECERSSGMSLGQALSLVNGPTLADAISDPNNAIHDLLTVEKNPAKIIEELYLAFLSRFPTAAESTALAASFDSSVLDNRFALAPTELAELESSYESWKSKTHVPIWTPLEIQYARGLTEPSFEILDDGSIRPTGPTPDKDNYTAVSRPGGKRITALRLEVLKDEGAPANGPGRAENGNFVLHELLVHHVPLTDPTSSSVVSLQNATADFSQASFPIQNAIDGKIETGWAVSPKFGMSHEAYFEIKDGLELQEQSLLIFNLNQQFGSKHLLGRFRLSTTDQALPVRHHNLPEQVIYALQADPASRTPVQEQLLFAHFIDKNPEWKSRIRKGATEDLAWALANSKAFLFNR